MFSAARHVEGAGRFDHQTSDRAVFDDHRVALRAHAHAAPGEIQFQPQSFGEIGAAVSQHHHLLADILIDAPSVHDKGVVHRHACDGVDALGGDLIGLGDETWQVLGRAGRRESAGQGENNHFFAPEQGVGRHLLDTVGGFQMQRTRRNFIPNLDGHVVSPKTNREAALAAA